MGGGGSKSDANSGPGQPTPRSQWPARTAKFPDVTGTELWRKKMTCQFNRFDVNNDGRLGEDDLAILSNEFNATFGLTGEPAARVLMLYREIYDRYYRGLKYLTAEAYVDRMLDHINGEFRVDMNRVGQELTEILTEVRHGKKTVERNAFDNYAKVLRFPTTQVEDIFMVLDSGSDVVPHDVILDALADYYFSEDPNSQYNILWLTES